jgi:hypothetical protein
MKKLTIVTSAALLLFTAALNAQTDTIPATQQPVATEKPVSKDKYNNWSAETYKMQSMPEALTTEKIFPVVGKYQVTDKEGASSTLAITLDETNKGIVWIDGLPQGRVKATLRKSPATYKIPAQKSGEEKDARNVAEGVLIYDKDANVLNLCVGCTFNNEDPATAFTAPVVTVAAETEKKVAKTKATKKSTAKVVKVKPVIYSGNKIMETTASATPEAQ